MVELIFTQENCQSCKTSDNNLILATPDSRLATQKRYNLSMSDFRFYHPIQIRYGDLDPQDHVNNAKFLTYFEQARIHYLIQLGLFAKGQSFMEVGIILAEVRLTFLAPVHFGTEVRVGARTTRLGGKSLDMVYILQDVASGQELASGTAVLVAYDYRIRKTIPIPANWREIIATFEGITT
jgi:acyl-CoA thioester hydrolase